MKESALEVTKRILVALAILVGVPETLCAQDRDLFEVARRVLNSTPLVDGHNDLPWEIRSSRDVLDPVGAYDLRARTPGHTDLERLRRGMVGGQFWSVYVDCDAAGRGATARQLEQIAIARAMIEAYPEALRLVGSADDLERAFRDGRIGSFLGMEGAHTLEGSVGATRAFRDLGVRYLGLTHNCTNEFADAALDAPRHAGLSEQGLALVRELNRLGVLVDLAHASVKAMHAALDVSVAPVIWSHASAYALVEHARNVPDDVLRRLPANGGVVMITFVPSYVSTEHRDWEAEERAERQRLETSFGEGDQRVFVGLDAWRSENPMPMATLAQVADHVEHVRKVAGVDHVGLGGDFDGITRVVRGLEDVSTYPVLFEELLRRGWGENELAKLAGGNILRALRAAEETAGRLVGEAGSVR